MSPVILSVRVNLMTPPVDRRAGRQAVPLGCTIAVLLCLPACRDSAKPGQAPAPVASVAAPAAAPAAPPVYVGSRVCAECHADQFESYLQTAHSRSLSLVDPASEPPDGAFEHAKSGRSYRVYREQGQMRHREWVAVPGGDEIAADYPLKYLVGSGRHSRTYLVEDDGFLVESPITWYASRKAWDLSPGYDVPEPPGFERPADMGCLACHVGRASAIDRSYHRIAFDELAIGCERCHGGGAEHVAFRRNEPSDSDAPSVPVTPGAGSQGVDPIVHPGKLSRELTEAICSQCHLRGDATVFFPGQGAMDHAPGRPLTANRLDYRVDEGPNPMKVVGHTEQMWLSRCYIESGTLTCTTCHQLHADKGAQAEPGFVRNRCLECHGEGGCRLPADNPGRTDIQDNCLVCHMPQTETDIPHIAFTHHRIGIHRDMDESPAAAAAVPVPLRTLLESAGTADAVQRRCLGLAYAEAAERMPTLDQRNWCLNRSRQLLEGVQDAADNDPEVPATLARLYWAENWTLARTAAQRALENGNLSPNAAVNALFVLADTSLQSGDPAEAKRWLAQLVERRRHSEDWLLLGIARQATRQSDSETALRRAAEINPFRADIAQALAELLARSGKPEEAAAWAARSRVLSRPEP